MSKERQTEPLQPNEGGRPGARPRPRRGRPRPHRPGRVSVIAVSLICFHSFVLLILLPFFILLFSLGNIFVSKTYSSNTTPLVELPEAYRRLGRPIETFILNDRFAFCELS